MQSVETNLSYDLLVGDSCIITSPLPPFSPILCDFVSSLSELLRNSIEAKVFPDIMTFAYWCRRGHIQKLRESYTDLHVRLGLGLVFHIAPSNVPVNFVFSFLFGFLSGNSNIVRVPSKSFPQVDIICHAIASLLNESKYIVLKNRMQFIRYERNDELTVYFSKKSQSRLIWGGDETIRAIRSIIANPRTLDIPFADRYSLCIMNSDAVSDLNSLDLKQLSKNFYNDAYVMDQNACSSPHLILWTGNKIQSAKEKFWLALEKQVSTQYVLSPMAAMDKYLQSCEDVIDYDFIGSITRYHNFIYCIEINRIPEKIENLRGHYGYFYELIFKNENEFWKLISQKCQTLTYFGCDPQMLRNKIIENNAMGIDRIVPVGNALDMNLIWDGYDVIKMLSRIITVT